VTSNRQRALIIMLTLTGIYALFIIAFERHHSSELHMEVEQHAQVVASSVWTLFTPATEDYLSLSVRNNNYKKLLISSLGDAELFNYRSELGPFETVLEKLGLIRVEQITVPVIYQDQQIGMLHVDAFNKNIYLYTHVAVLFLLLGLLFWFIGLIYRERQLLQVRVAEKTAELAGNNQLLQEEIEERVRSEQTFHALFDNSFQFIALLDSDGRVRKVNRTALKFRNLKEVDILGEFFWDTPWWRHSETLVKQLVDAFAKARSGQISRFEVHSTEIREIYLDVSLKPVFGDSVKPIYIIAEARDITEVRRTEQELQQAQKMESVGTLAGGIAHDFNNILGGILGTLSLLRLKRDKGQQLSEEKLFGYLDNMTETAMRAKEMVNQLLTLSRKYDLKFVPINLHDILNNVYKIAGNSFDKSIAINLQMEEDLPVNADANSLEQVFLNLCINAAHAMTLMRPPGHAWGGELNIHVKAVSLAAEIGRPGGDYWRVSIADSGVGIASSNLKQIFVPFFTTKTKEAGTGLGLSMVYNIVKQHKGFIDIESEEGYGSCFHVFLPVGSSEKSAQQASSEPQIEQGEGTILIIDDEELIRNNAAEMLEECGYKVLQAEDGEQGVRLYKLHQDEISAVLLDLVMPVMSGKETFSVLKKINRDVKVLLSSGFRQDERVEEILSAGAGGFIQKPYSISQLANAIKQLIDAVESKI
jgi:PAS domain S-box-containing protein